MGLSFSTNNPTATDSESLPITEHRPPPYFGLRVPREASTGPEDSRDWYTDFFEQAYVCPHRDGESLLVCWPVSPQEIPLSDGMYEGEEHVNHLQHVYELLFRADEKSERDHPRIVR